MYLTLFQVLLTRNSTYPQDTRGWITRKKNSTNGCFFSFHSLTQGSQGDGALVCEAHILLVLILGVANFENDMKNTTLKRHENDMTVVFVSE